jgi:6-phosphogluconolactonase
MRDEKADAKPPGAGGGPLPRGMRTSRPSTHLVCLVGLLGLGSLSCGGSSEVRPLGDPCDVSASGPVSFVYTANSNSDSVSGFMLIPDGHLCPIAGSPAATGRDPIAMAVAPSKRVLYVANDGSRDITGYTIAPQGTLTKLAASAATGATPSAVAVHPSGTYLYATCSLCGPGLWAYRIGASGDLSPIAGSPIDVGDTIARDVQVHPSGRFLYVAIPEAVAAFAIGDQGGLTPVPGSPFPADEAAYLAMDPLGRFLFVPVSDYKVPLTSDAVWVFAVGSDGALTQVAKFPLSDVDSPTDAVVDPSGRFLYVAAHRSGRILGLGFDSAGTLTPVPGSPFAVGSQPMSVAVDPSGRFVCTVDRVRNSVSSYEMGSNGSLTLRDARVTGLYPQAVAIAP